MIYANQANGCIDFRLKDGNKGLLCKLDIRKENTFLSILVMGAKQKVDGSCGKLLAKRFSSSD